MSETAYQGRVGVFGIGLNAYWEQFPGLKQRLEGYQRFVETQVAGFGVDVVSAGLVDTAPSAVEAGSLFARADLDLILCYIGTYATSSQVLPVVQRARVPVIVLNL
ncbi:MAG: arabinose isomerase, partial [Candidatus Solibacter sp.]|nr:arabinose isomerase [Candidatus Solibacter sp.]